MREEPRGEKAHSNATLSDSGAFVWRAIALVTNERWIPGRATPAGSDDERNASLFHSRDTGIQNGSVPENSADKR